MTFIHSTAPVSELALFRRSEARSAVNMQSAIIPEACSLRGLAVLHLGFTRDDCIVLGETLRNLGVRHVARSEHVYPLGLGKPGALCYDGIVVNLDQYADVEMGVDRLMRFRRACPSRFVVLATADVASDDFGHHRRAICDSTLKLPLTASRLTEAIGAALLNHRSISG